MMWNSQQHDKMYSRNIWNQPAQDDFLMKKLNQLYEQQEFGTVPVINTEFSLPAELQGGVSNISSRRPSYAAENVYTANENYVNSGAPVISGVVSGGGVSGGAAMGIGVGWNSISEFKSRRPSLQQSTNNNDPAVVALDNDLVLEGGCIVSSKELQEAYFKCGNYFCFKSSEEFYNELKEFLKDEVIKKIILNLQKLNNIFNLFTKLVLVLNKSGRFEILTISINSNLRLKKGDLVIIDGDRGKDIAFVLDPNLSIELAILINYLKKRQHLKCINYSNEKTEKLSISNTVKDLINGNGILDEETQFQIPSKQILRFVTKQEIEILKFKFYEEIKAFKTGVLKISNIDSLSKDLVILNCEYQFDQKKLIYYYNSNKRLDFRNLIKELFKIYKTRIWLCAVPTITNDELKDKECESFDKFNNDFHVLNLKTTFLNILNECV